MCGIVGIYYFHGKPVSEIALRNMAGLIDYRGPDDEGFWIGEGIGLGHKRLSIIDLSQAGHQPLCNEDGRIWIVFNGEIYNYIELKSELEKKGHIFRSNSDTEVIVHAYEEWGKQCVDRFNGMFAFCIWDDKQKEIFIARDRLGVKPLYYFLDGEKIVFASEIKCLFQAANIQISANPGAVLDYFVYQFVLGDETFFKGIKKLLPGHYLSIRNGTRSLVKYWELPSHTLSIQTKIEIDDLQCRLRELLNDSIKLRLRSDVPVGCFLSGGMDSSLVTCLAARHLQAQIKTFTGKFSESPEFDETNYAKIVSQFARTDYNELNVELSGVNSMLSDIMWYLDEPVAGPGVIPQYFISKLASRHVKVILGGQGGDELFGGYGWYRKTIFALLLRGSINAGQTFQSLSSLKFFLQYAKSGGALRVLEGIFRFGLRDEIEDIYSDVHAIIKQNKLKKLVKPDFFDRDDLDTKRRFVSAFDACRSDNIASQLLKFDIQFYLPALLHVEDRTSMSVSLESRLPFLDYRLVELAHSIPGDFKLGGGNSKYLLRESFKDAIPEDIYKRRDKKGFPTPIKYWFKGKNNELVQKYLISKESGIHEIFNRDQIMNMLHDAQSGKRRAAEKLWRCISVAAWYDNYINNYSKIARDQLNKKNSVKATYTRKSLVCTARDKK